MWAQKGRRGTTRCAGGLLQHRHLGCLPGLQHSRHHRAHACQLAGVQPVGPQRQVDKGMAGSCLPGPRRLLPGYQAHPSVNMKARGDEIGQGKAGRLLSVDTGGMDGLFHVPHTALSPSILPGHPSFCAPLPRPPPLSGQALLAEPGLAPAAQAPSWVPPILSAFWGPERGRLSPCASLWPGVMADGPVEENLPP